MARIVGVSYNHLWRVVQFYVAQALSNFELGGVKVETLGEAASKRSHSYLTIFIDRDRRQTPMIFVTP